MQIVHASALQQDLGLVRYTDVYVLVPHSQMIRSFERSYL